MCRVFLEFYFEGIFPYVRGRGGREKGGREGGRKEGRKGGREEGRKGGKKGGREGGREEGRGEGRKGGREGGREEQRMRKEGKGGIESIESKHGTSSYRGALSKENEVQEVI